jgi:hypothetical protein
MAKEENGNDKAMVAAACKAYGIDEKYLLSCSTYPDGTVVLLTHGGSKVSWKKGDEVDPLDPVQVDGIIRKKMKPVTGVKKKDSAKKD